MKFSIVWDIKPENIMFGGIYYHHKTVDNDNSQRAMMRERQETMKNKKNFTVPDSMNNLDHIISQSKEMVFNKLFNMKNETNPFANLEQTIASDNIDFIHDYLDTDTIVILPFNNFLTTDYKELKDRLQLSLIVLSIDQIHLGFFTPKKFLKQYMDKRVV